MKSKIILLLKIVLTGLLLFGTVFVSVTSAGPLLQDPRPDRGGSGGGGGTGSGGGGNGGSDSLPPAATCASLVGQVINWGSGGEGGITTNLDAGSWQLSTVSATDGNYGYGGLGIGAAKLHIALSPEQTERFAPLIQDAGVYLSCEFPIVANIALFGSGESIKPPATIEMSATRTSLGPGQTVDITLTVTNGLPNDITNVVVTDLFPVGLIPVDVLTVAGPEAVKIVDTAEAEKLVVINLSRMTTGAETTINISAVVDTALAQAGSQTSSATLFYRESVAHQDTVDFNIRPGAISAAAVEATATPLAADSFAGPVEETDETAMPADDSAAEVAPSSDDETISADEAALTDEAEGGEDFVPPNGLPTTGDSFVPPPMLPVTGQDSMEFSARVSNTGIGWVLFPLSTLVSALAVAGATFVWYHRRRKSGQLRASQKNESPTMPAQGHQDDFDLDLSPLRNAEVHPQKQKQN